MGLTANQKLNEAIRLHQEGNPEEAEQLYRDLLKNEPLQAEANHNLGVILQSTNKSEKALPLFKIAIQSNPNIEQFWISYINTLVKIKAFEKAKEICVKAIKSKPEFPVAYFQLGNILYKFNKFKEAEINFKKAIELKPNYPEAHNNLGIIFFDINELEKAEIHFKKAIELKPNYAKAYNNYGNTLKNKKKSNEAEYQYKKAIEFNPTYFEAYNNLGTVLHKLKKLDDAEINFRKSLSLNPNFAEAYSNLGNLLNDFGKLEEAEININKALSLKPNLSDAHKNLDMIQSRKQLLSKIQEVKKINNNTNFLKKISTKIFKSDPRLPSNPYITNLKVKLELINSLYKIDSIELNKTTDIRYGNGKCSDYKLFENNSPIIKNVSDDLIKIMSKAVNSEIFIMESFFNILRYGSGASPHRHVNSFDQKINLDAQKYSLTYYLSVGDQNCSEPGKLKLYDPDKEILPSDGEIIIFPANRKHSATYNGKKDRVMIGINFYSLI